MELKTAITIVELIIGVLAAMAIGDFLGECMVVKHLARIIGFFAIFVIVVFTIFAAVTLMQS